MEILITICARGGSKGIPGKNIRKLNGIPLIAYTINHAREFLKIHNGNIAISTDSEDIKTVCRGYDIDTTYTRPEHLATDKAGKVDAINDVFKYHEKVNNKKYDYVLDLDVSSPLRSLNDLHDAFSLIQNNKSALNLFSVSKAGKNPYFNMVEIQENGFYKQVKRIEQILSRQQAPVVYEMNASFYFYKRTFFEKKLKSAITEKSLIYLMDHICFDLDEQLDFDFMEYLLKHDKLDFQLI